MNATENNTSAIKEAIDTSLHFSKKTLQDYEVISVIGNGTFGTCFKVRDKENGQIYAWKGIDYDELKESQKESLVSEIRVLRQLQHPNIVQYFHHLVNYEAKSIFIVMECCEGGDLAQLITKAKEKNKRFEERYIWRVLFQICRALRTCHNKIKEGTILHRDIKPANIFLDTEGNVKLGDFGLARILKRNETFAETFVGTPYYMSPETIQGSKYDRKSDVWAVGCLIYEMCTLRPPFDGKEFDQLSANISMGKFSSIPNIYSKDLHEIIAYMLEVENGQRPSIEVISRHPLLVRNIYALDNGFPILVDIESPHQDFNIEFDKSRKLEYSILRDFSSTMFTEQSSFNEGYGQRPSSITHIFTPDLKAELFYSAKRKIFPVNTKIQLSDPELYESIRREDDASTDGKSTFKQNKGKRSGSCFIKNLCQPHEVKLHVFNGVFKERLQAITAQESVLRQREENLNIREQQLNEKEKRLIALEESLVSKYQQLKTECKKTNFFVVPNSTNVELSMPLLKDELKSLPPVPTRKPNKNNDTYCSIESNESSVLHQPTIAKLNISALPFPKAFPRFRKVTFLSPKKMFSCEIENKKIKYLTRTGNNTTQTHSSYSGKSSEGSSESAATSSASSTCATKRKSILSIFGITRKETTNSSSMSSSTSNSKKITITTSEKMSKEQKDQNCFKQEEHIISKCEATEINNIWTKEQKKAAFEMLAAMNAAETLNSRYFNNAPRQSLRDRNSLQRSRLRRSLIVPGRLSNRYQRDQIIV